MREDSVLLGYDHVIFDLDGVLILGDQLIPGADMAVQRVRSAGRGVFFATNNASRSPEQVADLLTTIGVAAKGPEVFTSGRAAATLLATWYPPGSPILVVGADSLAGDVQRTGLRPVRTAQSHPVAVLQGYSQAVGWADLAEACVAVRAGARWIATNTDRTLPSPRGPLPGNGALVAALATALDRQPDVSVGKPASELFIQAGRAGGAGRILVVGDRLDTDIEGANRAGMDSLLVLTGVSRPLDLLAARPERRPTYVAFDLAGLVKAPWSKGEVHGAGGTDDWSVRTEGTSLILDGVGSALGALWALCQAGWAHGQVLSIVGATESARKAVRRCELS